MKTLTNEDYSKDSPYYYGRGVEVRNKTIASLLRYYYSD